MQPTVRSIDQLMLENAAAYDPMRQSYRDQIAQSGTRLASAEQGLGAARDNAFGNITQSAVNRNMLFSGFSPDQQAKYTAEKYLPALANLRTANEENIGKLNQSIMGLDAEQRKAAMATREADLSKLYDYQKEQERRAWEAEQARIAYDREMARMREEQSFTAKQNAAARGGGGAGGGNLTETIRAMLDSRTGKDSKVSASTWRQIAAYAADNGLKFGGANGFANKFWQYVNTKHWKDYQQGYEKYM